MSIRRRGGRSLGVVLLCAGADVFGQGLQWQEVVTANAPSLRTHTAMVYDETRNLTVLFGGSDGSLEGDTWEWDGCTWTLRSTSGPVGRYDHAMAYDSTRGVTVLFGGIIDAGIHANDTWEWDGSTWTFRSNTGPAPRYGCRMAFDVDRNVVVLFGGVPNGPEETWEWNGNAWALRSSTGPAARYSHAMVYDTARHRTLLFGGLDPGGSTTWMGDTWQWDGSTWTEQVVSGPAPRAVHAMAYDAGRSVTLLFGGVNWSNSTP